MLLFSEFRKWVCYNLKRHFANSRVLVIFFYLAFSCLKVRYNNRRFYLNLTQM